MSDHQDDIDLLLSLQDRVPETPPASPSNSDADVHPTSDNGILKRKQDVDASVFFDAVQGFIEEESPPAVIAPDLKRSKNSRDTEVEKFSGLRIRNKLISDSAINSHLADIKFVRLSAIEKLLVGDNITGCWATIGVLTEIGHPRDTSTGKNYYICKFTCLNEDIVSVFLFGDAHKALYKDHSGSVFALLNSTVRKNSMGSGFSLSVYSEGQLIKIGTSVDYGVCKGKKKDGMACTLAINKRKGIYCKYHNRNTVNKYSSTRTELMGGNLKMACKGPRKQEGIYCYDPSTNKTDPSKIKKPARFISVEGLKKSLSKIEGRMTTNSHSQGLRFLAECAGINDVKSKSVEKSSKRVIPFQRHKKDVENKAVNLGAGKKMIELEYVSSDDEP